MGWHCITIWECQLKQKYANGLYKLWNTRSTISILRIEETNHMKQTEEEYSMVAEPAESYGKSK